ncbi:hypothetical protein HY636_03985 [Candidatus Woesearchaeota archaeon]|nr:hypothetical protein [Candidatus Woesearchaeota archaeon]
MSLLDVIRRKNSEKPTSKLGKIARTLGAVLAMYGIVETAAIVSNFVARAELELSREKRAENYIGRHKLYNKVFEPDEILGYKLRPNLDNWVHVTDNYNTIIMATDELGLRNWLDDKGSAKLVFVGGTASFGYSGKSITFPYHIQESGIDVSNFSVPGYLPWQMNEMMVRYPQFFKGKTILYCLSPKSFDAKKPINPSDYYSFKGWTKYEESEPVDKDLESEEKPLLEKTIAFWVYKTITDHSEDKITSVNSTPKRLVKEAISISPSELEQMYLEVEEAMAIAQSYGSSLKVVLFPSKASCIPEEYATKTSDGEEQIRKESEVYDSATKYFESKGVDVIDLTNPLREYYKYFEEYRGVGVFNREKERMIGREIITFLGKK